MSGPRSTSGSLGVWLVGAGGNVAVTVVAGLAALKKGLTDHIGLCTEAAPLQSLQFASFDKMVVGGHEIRPADPKAVLERLTALDRVLDTRFQSEVEGDLDHYQKAIRLGAEVGSDYQRLCDDIRTFQQEHDLNAVVVINVASTEAVGDPLPVTESALRRAADDNTLPISSVYALAALDAGAAYVNFTPSTGSKGAVFDSLFLDRGLVHAGRDGKTGETLLKAALLPMFAARNLRVESWFGQNILGNADGRSLQEPGAKSAKQNTKSALVEGILGYQPAGTVGIDYVEPLGDWKVAWDHVLFRGFLGTQMNLQLTWQGADSVLAAPLVIDLARICDFCMRRGDAGLLPELGFFFKEPMGGEEHALMRQYENLLRSLGASRT
jgi:myo-inositol-1-phosphate synthase